MMLPVLETGFASSWPYPDSVLLLVIRETADHNAFLRRINCEAYCPSPSHCRAEPLPPLPPPGPQSARPHLLASESASETTPALLVPASPSPSPSPSPALGRRAKWNRNKQISKKKAQKTPAGQRAKREVLGKDAAQCSYCEHNDDPEELDLDSEELSNCPYCADEPAENQCIQILHVKQRDCKDLVGGALTCAPQGQPLKPLKPKPACKPRNGSTPKPLPKIRYYDFIQGSQYVFGRVPENCV
ncbi:hypothetical protein K438DRAFT_903640 [Mycena galopus ATCC 62051]|nr:hypothetical protein K438DRAFT_903640 [Mycena galopus ATCC 62051]